MTDAKPTTRDIARTEAAVEEVRQSGPEASRREIDGAIAMFPDDEIRGYRARWDATQTGFVDEPRKAVEEADTLVAHVIKRLSEVFAEERSRLEGQWDRGNQISTEDLRVALQKYRSFFERLLSL
jgi:hypothetical protein